MPRETGMERPKIAWPAIPTATAAPAPHVAVLPPTVAPPSAIPAPTVAAAPTTAPTPAVAGKPAEKPLGEPKGAAVVEPKGYSGLIAQANRLLERGKSKDAQKLFERALVEQPGSLEAQNGLGYCFIDSERFGAAVDQFKQVLQTAPGNGDAIMGIAEAYKMRGDKVRALEFYRRYLAEQPNGPKARMAQTNVLELEQAVKHESPRPSGTEVQDHQLMPPGGTGGN